MQIADKLRRLEELRQNGYFSGEFAEQVKAQLLTESASTPDRPISEHLSERAFEIMHQNDISLGVQHSPRDYLGVCQLRRSDASGLSRVESVVEVLHTLRANREDGSRTLEEYYLLDENRQPGSDFWAKYLDACDRLRWELGEPSYEGVGPKFGYQGAGPDFELFVGDYESLIGWTPAARICWWQHAESLVVLAVTAHDACCVFELTLVRLAAETK